ncbi:hypothetical protein COLO4_20094 [Corchorus olitorius]|uniref:Uncharacterized protein n=1 Tax=Corchorus olitorius TaxID=93759 RepID=A0A1R3IXB9_9ROSI|nr:hypothetical protein COLO4_20736 [Corchorus olitorius]OMO88747.1 hypothetical protein COLO4_20094 [Corchorus olitorius]
MAEGLDLCSNFKLTEEENTEVVINKQWVAEAVDEGKYCLVGSPNLGVYSQRKPLIINLEVMRNLLH